MSNAAKIATKPSGAGTTDGGKVGKIVVKMCWCKCGALLFGDRKCFSCVGAGLSPTAFWADSEAISKKIEKVLGRNVGAASLPYNAYLSIGASDAAGGRWRVAHRAPQEQFYMQFGESRCRLLDLGNVVDPHHRTRWAVYKNPTSVIDKMRTKIEFMEDSVFDAKVADKIEAILIAENPLYRNLERVGNANMDGPKPGKSILIGVDPQKEVGTACVLHDQAEAPFPGIVLECREAVALPGDGKKLRKVAQDMRERGVFFEPYMAAYDYAAFALLHPTGTGAWGYELSPGSRLGRVGQLRYMRKVLVQERRLRVYTTLNCRYVLDCFSRWMSRRLTSGAWFRKEAAQNKETVDVNKTAGEDAWTPGVDKKTVGSRAWY